MATFQGAERQAYTTSERQLLPYERQIIQSYRDAYNEIGEQLQALYLKMQADGIPPGEYYNYATKFRRLEKLQEEIFREYNKAARAARNIQANANRYAITDVYYRNAYLYQWLDDVPEVFVPINPAVVEASALGSPQVWAGISQAQRDRIADTFGPLVRYVPQYGSLSEMLLNNDTQSLRRIQQIVEQGLIQGKSFSVVERELRQALGSRISKSQQIARTEGTRNLNSGVFANMQAADSLGVDVARAWDATLDIRTRATHAAADDQRRGVDEPFNVGAATGFFPGQMSTAGESVNCRCRVRGQVGDNSPQLRRARDPVTGQTDIISFSSFDAWARENNLVRTNRGWKVQT